MRKIFFSLLAAGLLLAGIFGAIQSAHGQDVVQPEGRELVLREVDGENVRELWAPVGAAVPDAVEVLSNFTTNTPYCYQPDPAKDECFINWYSIYADSAPDNIRTITTTLTSKGIMASYKGFFQTSMYISYNMAGQGYRVECGALGSGGVPTLGKSYAWNIKVEDATGYWISHSGTIYCPAYTP